jgi:hypothetical protein
MKKAEMQRLHGEGETHQACPKDWRDVPNLVGDYDLDATILHRANPSLPQRLSLYVKRAGAYHPRTGYSGYGNYQGDS